MTSPLNCSILIILNLVEFTEVSLLTGAIGRRGRVEILVGQNTWWVAGRNL